MEMNPQQLLNSSVGGQYPQDLYAGMLSKPVGQQGTNNQIQPESQSHGHLQSNQMAKYEQIHHRDQMYGQQQYAHMEQQMHMKNPLQVQAQHSAGNQQLYQMSQQLMDSCKPQTSNLPPPN